MELGPFELGAVVGEGGMGSVWAGRHRMLDVPVAMKVMSPELTVHRDFVAFFQREVRALARLSHPNVIWVHDHGLIPDLPAFRDHEVLRPGLPYLVMEYCDATLRERSRWLTSWDALRDVLDRLLSALGHAHARGVIHCDLKLDNVLVAGKWDNVDARPTLKLCDFGIALFRGEQGAARGTPSHMAPEQFAAYGGRQVGPWSDLYALGVLGWSLATGWRPFEGDLPAESLLERKLSQATGPFVPRLPVPEGLEGWLRGLLAPNPGQRFRSAADARAGLKALERTPVHRRASEEVTLPPDQDLEGFRKLRAAALPPTWRGGAVHLASASTQGAGLALLGLREPAIVEREAEREALWDALLDVSRTHRPAGVLLRGEEGVGTSALARWLAVRAEEEGGVVTLQLQGRGGSGDAAIGLLTALLRVEDLTDPTLARERLALFGADYGAALAALDALVAGVEDGDLRRGLVLKLLAAVARQRPVVVVLDAVDERKALRTLMARGLRSSGAVLWVGTAHAAPDHLPLRRIDVPRLGDASLIRVLGELLPLDDALAAEIAVRAQGRPRHAVDALRDLAASGDLVPGPSGWGLRPRADLRRELEVERWLEQLDPDTRRAAFLAAVIGRSIPSRSYYRASGELGVRVAAASAIEQMSRRGWLEDAANGWRFRSPAVRSSVLDFARGTLDWFGLHEVAAKTLEDDGAAPSRVGEVLLSGGEIRKGLRFIVSDLARVRESESRETALAVVRDAQDELESGTLFMEEDLHGELWWWEVDLLRQLGRVDACVQHAEQALDHCQSLGWSVTGARIALSRADLTPDDPAERLRWLALADQLGEAAPPELRAAILEREGLAFERLDRLREAAEAWRKAIGILGEPTDPAIEAMSLRLSAMYAALHGDVSNAVELAGRALPLVTAHTPGSVVDTLILYGESAVKAGSLRDGRRAFQEAVERSGLHGAPSARATVGMGLSDLLLGNVGAAEQSAQRALELDGGAEHTALALAILAVGADKKGRSHDLAQLWEALAARLERPRTPSDELAELLEMLAVGLGPVAKAADQAAQRERRASDDRRRA